MLSLGDTLDKKAKVPGRKDALVWCSWGMLETLQGAASDVQIASLPAWLRNIHSSKAKARSSAAGGQAGRRVSCFDISQSNVLVEVDGKI